ncbi:uncharacterized protein LOC127797544 [Diospyros lotus]|uniref:uncharacterized protein LOC127797544 n=1 Tax=Diospyros lotus TaxID=55363 RepID=UPI0022502410|nr:uncharacterized protein LOC127797544 [Diospyros lotus]
MVGQKLIPQRTVNPKYSVSLSMATAVSLSFLDSRLHHHHHHHRNWHRHQPPPFLSHRQPPPPPPPRPLVFFPSTSHYKYKLTFSSSCSDSSSSSPSPSTSSSFSLQDPFPTGRFLTNEEIQKLQFLENFDYFQELKSGSVSVRVMKSEDMDNVVGLLSESFAESLVLPTGYTTLLRFLLKQYLTERRSLMPHTATLIGFYREDGDQDLQLAGTVEVSFDRRGANASPPTPTAPKDSPYVCNMAVKTLLRRRGIGWNLLKASEELISQMCSSREVYLHCRLIDEAPLNMYAKAGYSIVKTDSILVLLKLRRRKHLMRKELPAFNYSSENSKPNEELPS